jgi:hypothetical protein
MSVAPYTDRIRYPLETQVAAQHGAFNDIIMKVARDQKVWCVDNNLTFAGRKELFVDFCHYTKEGIELLSDNYYDFIKDRLKRMDRKGSHTIPHRD